MAVTTFTTLVISIRKNLAPAGSGEWIVNGQGPLTFAAALLLVLATGVIGVSVWKFMRTYSVRRAAGAGAPANLRSP